MEGPAAALMGAPWLARRVGRLSLRFRRKAAADGADMMPELYAIMGWQCRNTKASQVAKVAGDKSSWNSGIPK